MKKDEVVNAILKQANIFLIQKNIKYDDYGLSVIPFTALLFMIVSLCIKADMSTILTFIVVFLINLFIFREHYQYRRIMRIYNKYQNIIDKIYQNKDDVDVFNVKHFLNYDWLNNRHKINYLIKNNNIKELKHFVPIFQQNTKTINFNNQSYTINKDNDIAINNLICDINDIKEKNPNLKYPEYNYQKLTENNLQEYYNYILNLVYEGLKV